MKRSIRDAAPGSTLSSQSLGRSLIPSAPVFNSSFFGWPPQLRNAEQEAIGPKSFSTLEPTQSIGPLSALTSSMLPKIPRRLGQGRRRQEEILQVVVLLSIIWLRLLIDFLTHMKGTSLLRE
eukprot:4409920-Prymnesium_polylepis.1